MSKIPSTAIKSGVCQETTYEPPVWSTQPRSSHTTGPIAALRKPILAARKRTVATYRLPVATISFFAISSVSATDISSSGPNSVPPPWSVPATWK